MDILTTSLKLKHIIAGLYIIDESDHCVVLKHKHIVVARFNAGVVTIRDIWDAADKWCDDELCPHCQVSWAQVDEMLQEPPETQNHSMAVVIIENCLGCREHFKGAQNVQQKEVHRRRNAGSH